jgi:hypothetical protein
MPYEQLPRLVSLACAGYHELTVLSAFFVRETER